MVPPELYGGDSLVVRPRDLSRRWSQPHKELRRLTAAGVVRRLAHGYYVVPPPDRGGEPAWRPEIEALALGLAIADYGPELVALMGVSAARRHGALPRGFGVGVVAVPVYRPALNTVFGRLMFVQRDITPLGVEPWMSPLGMAGMTTVEQTVLDLSDRPGLGGLAPLEVGQAIAALSVQADWDEALVLARRLRLHAAYVRAHWIATTVGLDPPPWPPRKPVLSLGLLPDQELCPGGWVVGDAPA